MSDSPHPTKRTSGHPRANKRHVAAKPHPLPINHTELALRMANAMQWLCARTRDLNTPIVPHDESSGQWYVVAVVPGREAIAAAHLVGRGYGIYLPMRRARLEGHWEKCEAAPLLPGYVFVHVHDAHRNRLTAIPMATGTLKRPGGTDLAPVPAASIYAIRRAEAHGDARLAVLFQHFEHRLFPRRRRRRRKSHGG